MPVLFLPLNQQTRAMSSPSLDQVGTFSIKHQAVGYGLLLGPLLSWIWFLLAGVGVTTTHADQTWLPMVITGIHLGLALLGIFVHIYYRNKSLEEAATNASQRERAEIKSAIINDKAMAVATVAIGLGTFLVAMTVYIVYFNGTTSFAASYHLNDTTTYLAVGADRLVTNKAMCWTFVASCMINILVFFVPWSHAALLTDVDTGANVNTKKSHFDAPATPMGHWNSNKSGGGNRNTPGAVRA